MFNFTGEVKTSLIAQISQVESPLPAYKYTLADAICTLYGPPGHEGHAHEWFRRNHPNLTVFHWRYKVEETNKVRPSELAVGDHVVDVNFTDGRTVKVVAVNATPLDNIGQTRVEFSDGSGWSFTPGYTSDSPRFIKVDPPKDKDAVQLVALGLIRALIEARRWSDLLSIKEYPLFAKIDLKAEIDPEMYRRLFPTADDLTKHPGDALAAMTIEQIRKLVRSWFDRAKEVDLFSKIALIVAQLGENAGKAGFYDNRKIWQQNELTVLWQGYDDKIIVTFKDKQVCSTMGMNRFFIPGPWVETIYQWHPVAYEAWEREHKSTLEKQRLDLLDKYGL